MDKPDIQDESVTDVGQRQSERRLLREQGRAFRASKQKQGKFLPDSNGELLENENVEVSFSIPEADAATTESRKAIPEDSTLFEIDHNIETISSIFLKEKANPTGCKFGFAVVCMSYVRSGQVKEDDGFEENILWTEAEIDYIYNNIYTIAWSKGSELKVIEEMHDLGAYICVVESRKLEFFEILHKDYGLSYPIARKLAVEFSNRALLASGQCDESLVQTPQDVAIKFQDRANQSQSPLEFLEEHYGRWLRGNGLYQHTLRKHDSVLMQYLDRRFVGRRDELSKILPKKSDEVNARLGPEAENMSPEQRKKALDAQRLSVK